jgi:hypothetical protein
VKRRRCDANAATTSEEAAALPFSHLHGEDEGICRHKCEKPEQGDTEENE